MNMKRAVPPVKISNAVSLIQVPFVPNCIVCPATINKIASPLNTLM